MKTHTLTGTLYVSQDRAKFEPDDSRHQTVTIPMFLVKGKLVDNDKVSVELSMLNDRGKADIQSIQVLERSREIVGRINEHHRVVPLHDIGQEEIMLLPEKDNAEKSYPPVGTLVAVRLNVPQMNADIVCGELKEVLDEDHDLGVETEIMLRTFDIPCRWDAGVLAEAEAAAKVPVSEHIKGRKDLRHVDFVTIDGEDAKDFDDAIFCEPDGDGWHVMVAIADVATYVKPGGLLDEAALERGNSIYFPSRVVPMLPSVLSDNVCSLRPHRDRLSLVCDFYLSAQGEVRKYQFFSAVIRSKARLTYTWVGKFFDDAKSVTDQPNSIRNMLMTAKQAFISLLQQRENRGALDLDTEETSIIFDKHGNVRTIISLVRNDAHRLIEEFMICANVCAAGFLAQHYQVLPYRVHGELEENIFKQFEQFFDERNVSIPTASSQGVAALLASVKGRSDRRIFQSIILRVLPKAVYQTDNIGHFGLALEQYTHFTSPIRRYTDLIVHRTIHQLLQTGEAVNYEKHYLDEVAEHLCSTEQRANEVSYDIQNFLKCKYAEKHIGKKFSGTIVGVTNFGLFIALDKIHIEGLLHISKLGRDYYEYDEVWQSLIGKRTKQQFTLGDSIEILLADADPVGRKIDLLPVRAASRKRKTMARGY